jgi:hypothetical protein
MNSTAVVLNGKMCKTLGILLLIDFIASTDFAVLSDGPESQAPSDVTETRSSIRPT